MTCVPAMYGTPNVNRVIEYYFDQAMTVAGSRYIQAVGYRLRNLISAIERRGSYGK